MGILLSARWDWLNRVFFCTTIEMPIEKYRLVVLIEICTRKKLVIWFGGELIFCSSRHEFFHLLFTDLQTNINVDPTFWRHRVNLFADIEIWTIWNRFSIVFLIINMMHIIRFDNNNQLICAFLPVAVVTSWVWWIVLLWVVVELGWLGWLERRSFSRQIRTKKNLPW